MIWESSYWKDYLLREAKSLRRRKIQRRWPPVSFARVEQSIMQGFYAVRKLSEGRKISDSLAVKTFEFTKYPSLGKPTHHLNWHKTDELYDFSRGHKETEKLAFICNQFIHSYVFQLSISETGLDAISVSSDRIKNKFLYCIRLNCIIKIFEMVGRDYPAKMHMNWSEERHNYEITVGH
jgi:hypothetical protein